MIFYTCLIFSLIGTGSSLTCSWLNHRFLSLNKNAIQCLNTMANDSMNNSNDSEAIIADFPHHLYMLASKATDGHRLHFVVQVLDEVADLFEQDHSSTAWGDVTLDHFLQAVTRQADGLRQCYKHHGHSRRLHMYFKRLTLNLQEMEHTAGAWELIRAEIKLHLFRAQELLRPLMADQ